MKRHLATLVMLSLAFTALGQVSQLTPAPQARSEAEWLKVRLTAPTKIKEVNVQFELKDLPLPF